MGNLGKNIQVSDWSDKETYPRVAGLRSGAFVVAWINSANQLVGKIYNKTGDLKNDNLTLADATNFE